MPILLDMTPTKPNKWDGQVYNSKNGKTYSANISLFDPNTLRIQGCVLGFLCGGENWTRVETRTVAGHRRKLRETGAGRPQDGDAAAFAG